LFLPGGRVTSMIVRIINIYARYMCGMSSGLRMFSDGLRRFYAGGKEEAELHAFPNFGLFFPLFFVEAFRNLFVRDDIIDDFRDCR